MRFAYTSVLNAKSRCAWTFALGSPVDPLVKSQIAGYTVPRTVVFGELPKTSTGKIQKFKLREKAEAA